MKKILIFVLIMSFGMINNVNALSYDYNIGQEISVNTSHWDRNVTIASSNSQSGLASTDFTFDKTYQFNNSKFIRFTYTSDLVTSNSSTELINWTETCSSTQFITATGSKTFTVTYADGSHATISGNITDYEGYCSQYTSTGTVTSSSINISEFTPQIYLMTSGGGAWSQCEMDNSFILCPVIANLNYSGLRLYYYRQSFSGGNAYFSIYLRKDVLTINTDAQQIINNNNTNTQTIHNDNQQQYNFISNTTIDTNTTNDALDINSSMNTDTSNVVSGFMLIPINFFSTIIQSFQNQCSQVCIGECGGSSGGGHDDAWRFIFPCINIENLVGSTIYNLIDILFAFGMLFAFIRSVKNFLYKALMLTNDAASEVGVFL